MDDGDFAWWSITLLQSTFMPTSVNLIQCLYQCSIVNCPPPIARKWPRDTLQYFKLSRGHFRTGDSLKYYTDNSWELSSGDTAPIPRTDSYLYRLSLIFQLCSPFFISENTVVLFLYHHVFCSEINMGSTYSRLHVHSLLKMPEFSRVAPTPWKTFMWSYLSPWALATIETMILGIRVVNSALCESM